MIPSLISPTLCQQVKLLINCSSDQPQCEVGNFEHILNETSVTLQTNINCGECSLHAKVPQGYEMKLTWIASTWGPFNYFYINQTNGFLAFTGPDDTCQLFVNHNEFQAQFFLNGSILIHSFKPSGSTLCHTSNNCMLSNRCNNLHWVQQIYVVRYEELSGNDIFLADFPHFRHAREYWPREARGQLPQCNHGCECTLHYQRLVAHCDNGITIETILIHHKITFPSEVRITLDAADFGIMTIAKGAFQGHEHVIRLDLSDNPLSTVRPEMFDGLGAISLEVIQLMNCNFTELPSDIFDHLFGLFYVDLSENQLTALHPDTFSHQLFLLALILKSNLLSSLPANIFRISKNMQWLDLGNNQFTELNPNVFKPVPELRLLILDHNEFRTLSAGTFKALTKLDVLTLQDNNLEEVPPEAFEGLNDVDMLDLSGNRFSTLKPGQFKHFTHLVVLVLNRNNLKAIPRDAFDNTKQLRALELESNEFQSLDLRVFDKLDKLLILKLANNKLMSLTLKKELNSFPRRTINDTMREVKLWPNLRLLLVENNSLDYIEGNIFREMPQLALVDVQSNPLMKVEKSTFQGLDNETRVFASEASTCCFITNAVCSSENPKAPYLTCQRLLPNIPLQLFMWTIGIFAVIGNLSVMTWRCLNHGQENAIQVLLIQNLAASDLLMGVYMLIVASADAFYQQYFPSYADIWRNGPLCKLAGILSIVSSEASVFFVTLISVDRFMAISNSFRQWRVSKKVATRTLVLLWILALLLSIIPTVFSGVEPDFYDVSEVCIGLPFVRFLKFVNTTDVIYEYDFEEIFLVSISSTKEAVYYEAYHTFESSKSPGLFYSIALFLGLNLFCFIVVFLCYLGIFIIYKRSQHQVRKSNLKQQLNLAFRMGLIVLTDFTTWIPIVVIGILVQSSALTISPVVNVYIVVFVLPINSAVNPFLYSVATIISNYKSKKQVQRQRKGNNQKPINMTILAPKS